MHQAKFDVLGIGNAIFDVPYEGVLDEGAEHPFGLRP